MCRVNTSFDLNTESPKIEIASGRIASMEEVEETRRIRMAEHSKADEVIARADRWLARQLGKHAISREEAGARVSPTWAERKRYENA